MVKYLVILILVMFTACKTIPKNEKSIITQSKWPIVKLELNGKSAYFLIDCGSTATILDLKRVSVYGVGIDSLNHSLTKGIGGMTKTYFAENAEISFNNIYFNNEDYLISDLQEIFVNYEIVNGIKLIGIIGNDLLMKYGFVIDYEHNTLYTNYSGN